VTAIDKSGGWVSPLRLLFGGLRRGCPAGTGVVRKKSDYENI